MTFGEKLQELRKANSLSQEELAQRLNISRQAVSRWEQGTVTPDVSNVVELSKLFRVSTDYLLRDEFESDRDIPAVVENSRQNERMFKNRLRLLSGILVATLGAIGVLVLCIVGSVKGSYVGIHSGEGPRVHQGISAFLIVNHLEWLMAVSIITIVAGLVLVAYPRIRRWWNWAQDTMEAGDNEQS